MGLARSQEIEAAIEKGRRICKLIEELPAETKENAPAFFDDVHRKAGEVADTIDRSGHCSDKQANALSGWEAGVRKWIRVDAKESYGESD